LKSSHKILLVLAAFVATNIALQLAAVPDAAWTFSADGASWLNPALGLFKHGGFVHPDTPNLPEIFRTPGYPTFLAATILLGGERFFDVAVPIQIVLLFAIGMIAYRVTEDWLPGYGIAALTLTVFNPNSLGTAHIIQSETLYALGVALLGWAVLAYCRQPSIGRGALAGLALGASCLIRPDAQFLVVLLPLGLVVLGALPGAAIGWGRRLAAAAVCLVVSVAVVAPWAYRNAQIGYGFRLTTAASASYYIWDSAGQIEMMANGVSQQIAGNRMRTRQAAFVKAQGPAWQELSKNRRDELLFAEGVRTLLSYPPQAIGRTVLDATLQFFAAGGAGNLMNILGYAKFNPYEAMGKRGHSSYLAAWRDALGSAAWPAMAITLTAIAFVVVLRLLGLAGIVTLARRRQWRLLAVILGAIAYFAMVIPFYGNSRFRVPVEYLLVLLALAGVDGLRRRRKVTSPTSMPNRLQSSAE
jgi:hypothetical protein